MMADREETVFGVDRELAARVASMSRGGQRWLKAVLQAVKTTGDAYSADELRRAEQSPPSPVPKRERQAAGLEEVVTGQADLREQLEAFPELAEELEGLAEIIDILREAGEKRRRLGEKILREEILGEPSPEHEEREE
jgi:hypothetical protein